MRVVGDPRNINEDKTMQSTNIVRILILSDDEQEKKTILALKDSLAPHHYDFNSLTDTTAFSDIGNCITAKYDLFIIDTTSDVSPFDMYRQIRSFDNNARIWFMVPFKISQQEFGKVFPSFRVAQFVKKPLELRELHDMLTKELS